MKNELAVEEHWSRRRMLQLASGAAALCAGRAWAQGAGAQGGGANARAGAFGAPPGDALVKVPRDKILFMGDIAFFGVTPLNGSGFIEDWIKVCDHTIEDDSVETIVPGHGPVGGKAQLKEMRGYLELLWREGRKKFDAGISAGRAAAEIDLGPYASWTGADRIATNMARVYSEFRGTLGSPADRDSVRQAVTEYNELKGRR